MNILDEIISVKKEEVKVLRNKFTLNSFNDIEFFEAETKSFLNSISQKNDISIIAEIKKASPSKGIIKSDFNHLKIAEQYLTNEVDAISILTDENFFQGSINFLNDIAKIKTVPLLRKDFIIDEYQVFEAKANGADLILLISEALSQSQINELSHAAYEIGLEVLLELHSKEQIEIIDFELNKLIGINNRNLKDFSVSLEATNEISNLFPAQTKIVSESGISKKEDLDFLKDTRTNAILVGEHLMKSQNIKDNIEQLKEWCRRES